MTREEYIDFANALKNNYTIDFDKLSEFCDMALSALPEEGAELIDRRQIKWYGCDHEGHIKGIDCDTADCSKCFFATVEHDEVMSLPVYRIPDSAGNKGHWGRRIVDNGFNADWVCSECGHREYTDFIHMNFCPNCGADMREPKGEKGTE